jgi:hypothetical protein
MNRFIILLTFFAMLVSFATSIPLKRDTLSGFKQCEGQFQNTITLFSYSPDPIVPGKNVTLHIGGEATEIVQEGALITFTGYVDKKEVFHSELDYCEYFVEQSGSKCPVETGHFDFTSTWLEPTNPEDPKDVVVEYEIIITSE